MIDLRTVPSSAFVDALEGNLRRLATPPKVQGYFVEALELRFEADAAWIDRLDPKGEPSRGLFVRGNAALRDEQLVREFARATYPEMPRSVLLAPLKVHDRLWGVVGVARASRDFEMGSGRDLNRMARVLGEELERREDVRLRRVDERIREKIVAELRPRDLAYQILDGLYELVHYDHSAALLVYDAASEVLRVDAEKIVWTKTKSPFVGREIAATPDLLKRLRGSGRLHVLLQEGSGEDAVFEALLSYQRSAGLPAPRSVLAASLFFESDLLGVLRIASHDRPPLNAHDRQVVEQLLPAAAAALRNARVRVSLEDQALKAEMRAGLVTLARAVAHDVNNAIGTLLPLAEQLREEARCGRPDPATLESDLSVIIEKATLCHRIFSNMLRVTTGRTGAGPVDANRLVTGMLPMLEALAAPRRATLLLDLASDAPLVRFSRDHLERIVWNLVTNAVEAATGRPIRITVRTRAGADGSLHLTVTDDGPGIPDEILSKVQEPFFTTKPDGTGLGLSICRSLAWQFGGTLAIETDPERGTVVRVTLPAASTLPGPAGVRA